jgi:dihydroneopterin aldolase
MTLLTNKKSSIHLRGVELHLNLGWTAEERAQKQTLLIDVLLQFPNPPKACLSDELEETYCYGTLINAMVSQTQSREFRLVEYLGAEIYQIIKTTYPTVTHAVVSVHKNLAVVNLPGTVEFQFGDL